MLTGGHDGRARFARALRCACVNSFSPSFEDLKAEVDGALERFLDDRARARPESAPLVDEIRRVLGAGGKRMRPTFCYWGYRAAGGGHSEAIVLAAGALELLHTFALVHDDIMDGSDSRRGEPTVHATRGLDFALLVGDLALVLADSALLRAGSSFPRIVDALELYSRMREDVIAGQFLDLSASGSPVSEDEARGIARLKSGRYTVRDPLLVGATLADAPSSFPFDELSRFGEALGEAFQLRDDLLGTFGDPSRTGKPIDSDIREGKPNLLFAAAMSLLEPRDRDYVAGRWGGGADLDDDEIERIRRLLDSCGARRRVEELLIELVDETQRALRSSDIDEEARYALDDLVGLASARDR